MDRRHLVLSWRSQQANDQQKMHAGADKVKQGISVRVRHSEIQIVHYGVKMEFNDEVCQKWILSLLVGVLLMLSLGVAMLVFVPKNKK